jgi:hypothetical protein
LNTTLSQPTLEHRAITLSDLAALVAGVAFVMVLPRSQSYWPYRVDFLGPWPKWLPWCFCLRQTLGAVCMVLAPVILRRRMAYGGFARPAERLALFTAMPFFADAIETGLKRLHYRMRFGHSLAGYSLDGMPTSISMEWWDRVRWIWELAILISSGLALAVFLLGRRRLPGWLLTAIVPIAWLGAYRSAPPLVFGVLLWVIEHVFGSPINGQVIEVLWAAVGYVPRFTLYLVPAIVALLSLRPFELAPPTWLEWTSLAIPIALFATSEPTELIRLYSTMPNLRFWLIEAGLREGAILAAVAMGPFWVRRIERA